MSTSEDAPQVRAAYMKGYLGAVDRLPPAEAEAIRNALSNATIGEIDDSIRMAWLPLELNVAITHAVIERLGAERAKGFFQSMFSTQLKGGMLERFVQTGLRVLGMDPASFLKWAPRAYPTLFRNTGRMTVTSLEPGRAVFRLEDLPSLVRHDQRWLDAVLWGIGSFTTITGEPGETRYGERDPAGRWVDMELRW